MDRKIERLSNTGKLRALADAFYLATGVSFLILAPDGKILLGPTLGNGCTSICVFDAKANPFCTQCRAALTERLGAEGRSIVSECPLGFACAATPIVIEDDHLANCIIGPFLHEELDEEKLALLRERTARHGFSGRPPLGELPEIPVIARKRVNAVLDLLVGLVKLSVDAAARQPQHNEADSAMQERLVLAETMLNAIPAPLFMKGKDGRLLGCNQAFEAFAGKGRPDSQRNDNQPPAFEVFTKAREESDERLLKAPGKAIYEGEARDKDGAPRAIMFHKATVVDSSGAPAGVACVMFDVTKRKQAEMALKESEQRLRVMYETMAQGVIYQDAQGRIISANPAAQRILGLSEEELLSRDSWDERWGAIRDDGSPFPVDEHPSILALRTGKMVQDVVMGVHTPREDAYRWISITAAPIIDASSRNPVEVYTVFNDITAAREAVEELRCCRSAVEASQELMEIHDRDLRCLLVNRAYLESHGLRREDVVGRRITETLEEESIERATSDFERCLSGESLIFEEERDLPGQGLRSLLVHRSPIFDHNGVVQAVVTSSIDITAMKQVEGALKAREATIGGILNAAPVGIGIVHNRILGGCNNYMSFLSGYSASELRGRSTRILYDSDEEFERIGHDLYEQIERYGVGSVAMHFRRKDGKMMDVLLSSSPIDAEDLDAGIIYTVMDITDRNRAEEELRESKRSLSTLLENLPGMAYRCRNDRYWTMEFISDGCFEATGYQPSDFIGNAKVSFSDIIYPEDQERIWREIQKALLEEQPFELEYRIRTANGEERWFFERGSGVFGGSGEILALEGFISDVTDRKQLQDQYLQAQKMESIGRLAGGVAHDFNNLLGAVLGYSELLLQEVSIDDRSRDYIEQIQRAGLRARDLTRQLLAFGRKQTLEKNAIDINRTIRDFQKLLQRTIREDVKIDLRMEDGLPPVEADVGQIEQVVMNLAINAQDAMRGGGVLTIETRETTIGREQAQALGSIKPGRYVMLTVSDTGNGMDEATLARIFEPFFTTKKKGEGTGLGLSTVYGIVKQHGGGLSASSESGQGSTFRICLPASVQEIKSDVVVKETAQACPQGCETILLVEDEDQFRELACNVLRKQGYRVLEAANGYEGLELVHSFDGQIRLLLTDAILPNMNGRELYEKAALIRPDMKALYMSGHMDDVISPHGVLEQSAHFLQKPFSIRALANKIREVLDATQE
ncbi:MAG: PAS domain S-box protein [Syntrophobacteraceae bacterium]